MIEDLFVPDPPAGDNSNRLPTTRFVQNAAASAVAAGPTLAGLSVLGNASTVAATTAAITGTADQLLAVNHAATTVLFTSVSSYIDTAIASTQGAVLYRNAATWVALAPGTQSTFLQTQGAGADPQWAAPVLSKAFISAEQIITAAASLTLAHGLGVVPVLMQSRLVNKTAEFGYNIADQVVVDNGGFSGPQGMSLVPDATNLNIRFANNANYMTVIHKTSGANNSITNASWRVVFRAWA